MHQPAMDSSVLSPRKQCGKAAAVFMISVHRDSKFDNVVPSHLDLFLILLWPCYHVFALSMSNTRAYEYIIPYLVRIFN